MAKFLHPPFDGGTLEALSKALGDTEYGLTGSEIGKFLLEAKLKDTDPSLTKWKRIYNSFVEFTNRRKVSNNILTFIQLTMSPARNAHRNEIYEEQRARINIALAFQGLQLSENGKLEKVSRVQTISDAKERVTRFKNKLTSRGAHPMIFTFCKEEILAENYFHTVFEATKSIAEMIRQETGLLEDGTRLIELAFCIEAPLIKINALSTETEKSEHKGLANLIKGVFGMFRNTTAHVPKVIWQINEADALDILSTISFIHRKLDYLHLYKNP